MLLGIRTHLSLSISVTGSTLLLGENWALMQSKWNNKQREEDRDAAVEKMKCAADNFHLAALQWETGPHNAQFNLQWFQRPVWCRSDYSKATKYPTTTTTTMHKLLLLQGSELNTTALHQMKWLIMRLLQLGEYYRQTHKNTTSLVKISLRLTSIFSLFYSTFPNSLWKSTLSSAWCCKNAKSRGGTCIKGVWLRCCWCWLETLDSSALAQLLLYPSNF